MKNWNESNKYANELRGRGHVGHTADDVDAEQCAAALTLWARRPPGGARWAPPLCPAAPANHRASLFIGPFSRNFFIISRSADWRLFYFLSIFFFFLNNLFIYFLNLIEFCWVLLLVSPPPDWAAISWRRCGETGRLGPRPPPPPGAASAIHRPIKSTEALIGWWVNPVRINRFWRYHPINCWLNKHRTDKQTNKRNMKSSNKHQLTLPWITVDWLDPGAAKQPQSMTIGLNHRL